MCLYQRERKDHLKRVLSNGKQKSHRETGTDDAGLASFFPFSHLPVGGRWEEDERGKCLALVVDVFVRVLLFQTSVQGVRYRKNQDEVHKG